jgi:prophage antirepressor-like protein
MRDGEAHFVANDVGKRLGYANASNAMTEHCKGITKRYPLMTPNGVHMFCALARSDVLRLIVGSTISAARPIRKWGVRDELSLNRPRELCHRPGARVMRTGSDPHVS